MNAGQTTEYYQAQAQFAYIQQQQQSGKSAQLQQMLFRS